MTVYSKLRTYVKGLHSLIRNVSGTSFCKTSPELTKYSCLFPEDRMPIPIGNFISNSLYDGKLKSEHKITSSECVKFVDVPEGEEDFIDRSSVVSGSMQRIKISLTD